MKKAIYKLLKGIEPSIYANNLRKSLKEDEHSMIMSTIEYLNWKK
jgi:hypothetical protein